MDICHNHAICRIDKVLLIEEHRAIGEVVLRQRRHRKLWWSPPNARRCFITRIHQRLLWSLMDQHTVHISIFARRLIIRKASATLAISQQIAVTVQILEGAATRLRLLLLHLWPTDRILHDAVIGDQRWRSKHLLGRWVSLLNCVANCTLLEVESLICLRLVILSVLTLKWSQLL